MATFAVPRGMPVFREEDCSPFDISLVYSTIARFSDTDKFRFIQNSFVVYVPFYAITSLLWDSPIAGLCAGTVNASMVNDRKWKIINLLPYLYDHSISLNLNKYCIIKYCILIYTYIYLYILIARGYLWNILIARGYSWNVSGITLKDGLPGVIQ